LAENVWQIIGWLGLACFFTRFLVQWIASERAGESVAPPLFWVMSIGGAVLLMLYSVHRGEPIFLVGYVVTLSVYLRNLWIQFRGSAGLGPVTTSLLALLAGVLLVTQGIEDLRPGYGDSLMWLTIGVVGQGTWSSRFVVQWLFTERMGISHFPEAFWWISLSGNSLLLTYAIHVGDPIWIAGLCLGPVVQIRNLMIMHRKAV
jgi:4-amino-4-deoxy-L-arabinose transferase